MQDFAPFTPEFVWALKLNGPQTPGRTATAQSGLKGHFMLWRATRLRNVGVLLVTYFYPCISGMNVSLDNYLISICFLTF